MLIQIDVDKIKPNPEQPRKAFDKAGLAELAASIKERGLLHPVIVEPGKGGVYFLHDGERRWRAAKLAELKTIEAVVREPGDKQGRLTNALVANIQREDMNVVDEARAFARLRDEFGWSVNKIQIQTGVSLPRVSSRLEMLKLEPEILEMVGSGKLHKDRRVVDALLSIPDSQARVKIAVALVQRHASIPAIQYACKALVEKMAGKKLLKNETPAVHFAEKKKSRNVPAWDQLQKQGKLPSWEAVKDSAAKTCQACDWHENPSDQICGHCPAVELIVAMVSQ